MEIDLTAAARPGDPQEVRAWLADQRVFISSAMSDTGEERQAVAAAINAEGARPVWFEELGRDASSEEAYLLGVDSSTIYLAILKNLYGTLLPSGFSPTEEEYMRAREGGKRILVYVAADESTREGHLRRFIDRVRVFVTTESYAGVDDLVRRLRRRLHELAAERLSPWVKLGRYVFRADLIDDSGDTVSLQARVSEDIAHALEQARDRRWGRERMRLTYASRVVEGEIAAVRRTTRAGGASMLEVRLERVTPPQASGLRSGISGMSPAEVVESGLRRLLFGEPLPAPAAGLSFMADPGVDADDLAQAFDLPTEVVDAIVRLVITEGLVGSGNATRILALSVGPRNGGSRRVALEWEDAGQYAGASPARRRIEGNWQRR
ncbi:MAG: DUF4062 domain-containing protein [Actinobacteria bacterium]|nr:DUF4062 domain-containing protein [Actinomycetota bacterium]